MDSPVAYIEHHKGGDNLVWDDPGWNRTPLYAAPQGKPESSVNSGDESGPPAESASPCVVESQWIPVNTPPTERGWYGILDAQDEPRAAMYLPKQGWIHQAVAPLKAWCRFPSLPERNGEDGK